MIANANVGFAVWQDALNVFSPSLHRHGKAEVEDWSGQLVVDGGRGPALRHLGGPAVDVQTYSPGEPPWLAGLSGAESACIGGHPSWRLVHTLVGHVPLPHRRGETSVDVQTYSPGEPPWLAGLPGVESTYIGGDLVWRHVPATIRGGAVPGIAVVQLHRPPELPRRARLGGSKAMIVYPRADPLGHGDDGVDGSADVMDQFAMKHGLCEMADNGDGDTDPPSRMPRRRYDGYATVATLTCPCGRRNGGGGGHSRERGAAGYTFRVGEASNPGPCAQCSLPWVELEHSPIHYPSPGREGFHGVHTVGFEEEVHPPLADSFSLVVVSVNGTAWGSIQAFLSTTHAHVVCAQEHRLPPQAIAAASAWARRRGWKSVWTPAVAGAGGGWSAGTAIFARSFLGLRHPAVGSEVVAEGRVTAAVVEAPACRPFLTYSGYLFHGQGPSRANLDLLAAIGQHYEAHGDERIPFVIAADFNMSPEAVDRTALPARLSGKLVVPDCPRGTCRTRTRTATFDYFVMSESLAEVVRSVDTIEGTDIRTHVPVAAQFHARPAALKALGVRSPPPLPLDAVYGPRPPPPKWKPVQRAADRLCKALRRGCDGDEAKHLLSAIYGNWLDLAERELMDVTGAVTREGCRSRGPRMAWRSILPERVKTPASTTAALAWATDLVRDSERVMDGDQVDDNGCHDGAALADDLVRALDDDRPPGREALEGDGSLDRVMNILHRVRALVARRSRDHHDDDGGGGADDLCDDRGTGLDAEIAEWKKDQQACLAEFRARHATAVASARTQRSDAWKEWIRQGAEMGARNAHLFSRLPQQWRPEVVETPSGRLASDPASVLAAQRRKYEAMWKADGRPGRYAWTEREALPRLQPEELREASRLFKRRTAVAYDGLHCRHYSLLGDEALSALATVLEACELLGDLPRQCGLVVTPLLEKPKGGYRPVAIYPSLYRIWTKARRAVAEEWESTHRREYFSASGGNGPLDTTWRQAVRQEAAVSGGGAAASIFWDLEAFFEKVDRARLMQRARESGFPLAVLRLSLAAYSTPRLLSLNGRVSRELWTKTGVGAGCGLACTYVKIYSLAPMDALVPRLPPGVTVDLHVDDFAVSAEAGQESTVLQNIDVAQRLVYDMINDELGATVSIPKAAMVASSLSLAHRIRAVVGSLAGPIRQSAPNLGVDTAAGRPRGTRAAAPLRRQRLRIAWQRKRRLRVIAEVIGARAKKVYTAGVGPGATFYAAVQGLSDKEALLVRRVAAAVLPPRSRFRSLRMVHLVNDMPTASAEVAATVQYTRSVWTAVVAGAAGPRFKDFDLPGIRRAWETVQRQAGTFLNPESTEEGRRRDWRSSRGPIAAVMLELDRAGWSTKGPFLWVDDQGTEVCVTATPPALMRDLLRASIRRQAERQLGKKWAEADPSFCGERVCIDGALHALRADKRLTPKEKGAFQAVLTGGVLTMSEAARRGYDVVDACPLCGEAGDTIYHRTFGCCATRDKVKASVPAWLWEEAQKASPRDLFWTTATVPHPADRLPRPLDDYLPHAVEADGERGDDPAICGHIFVDGSCATSVFRGLQRAAFALVQVGVDGRPIRTISLPLWASLPQTSQAAEYAAYAAAPQILCGESTIYGDCKGVLDHAARGGHARFDGRRRYAGVMLSMNRCPEGLAHIKGSVKVKAHQNPAALQCPTQRWRATGNNLADAAAKEALKRHPQPSVELRAQLTFWQRRIPHVVRAVATAMAEFPAAGGHLTRTTAGRRAPKASDAGVDEAPDRHRWTYAEGRWRCNRCWSYVLDEVIPARRAWERCEPGRVDSSMRRFEQHGHTMLYADGVLPIAYCARCGGWSSRRAQRLLRKCGPPTAAGRAALRRIERGLHPWRARDKTTGTELPRTNLTTVARHAAGGHGAAGGDALQGLASGCAGGPCPVLGPLQHADADLQDDDDGDAPVGMDCGSSPGADVGARTVESDEDVFGHGGSLDEVPLPDERALPPAAPAEAHEDTSPTKRARITDGRVHYGGDSAASASDHDPRLRGASLPVIISAMKRVLARERAGGMGCRTCTVFNSRTGAFVEATVEAVEAEGAWLRAQGFDDYGNLRKRPRSPPADDGAHARPAGADACDVSDPPHDLFMAQRAVESDERGQEEEPVSEVVGGRLQDLPPAPLFRHRHELLASLRRGAGAPPGGDRPRRHGGEGELPGQAPMVRGGCGGSSRRTPAQVHGDATGALRRLVAHRGDQGRRVRARGGGGGDRASGEPCGSLLPGSDVGRSSLDEPCVEPRSELARRTREDVDALAVAAAPCQGAAALGEGHPRHLPPHLPAQPGGGDERRGDDEAMRPHGICAPARREDQHAVSARALADLADERGYEVGARLTASPCSGAEVSDHLAGGSDLIDIRCTRVHSEAFGGEEHNDGCGRRTRRRVCGKTSVGQAARANQTAVLGAKPGEAPGYGDSSSSSVPRAALPPRRQSIPRADRHLTCGPA